MVKKKFKITGFIFLLLGINIILFNCLVQFSNEKIQSEKLESFLSESTIEDHIGVLEIPSINLKRGFYDLSFKQNNVNKNIQVIETSTMPDVSFGNLILAAHSGNSKISYFKNLYKLKIHDIAYIYYNERKYTYQLINIYNEDKDGSISIRRPSNQTNLTLITCDKKNKTLQNIYIFKMVNN